MRYSIGIILCFFFFFEITSKLITFSRKKSIDRLEDRTITKLFNKFENRLSSTFSKRKLKIHQHNIRGKVSKQAIQYDQLPRYGNILRSSSALHKKSLRRDAENMKNTKQGIRKEFEPNYTYPAKVLTKARPNTKEVKAHHPNHHAHHRPHHQPPPPPPPPKTNEDSQLELISMKRAHNPVRIPISHSSPVSNPSFGRQNISTMITQRQNMKPTRHQERENPHQDIRSKMLKEGRNRLRHKPSFLPQPSPSPHKPVEMIAPGIGVNEHMMQFVQLNHTPMEMESNSEWR